MVRVALSGASGFIGRHVLAELCRHPVQVVALTRSASRLNDPPAGVRVVEMDLALPGADCFDRLGRPELLIHLAWNGLPDYKSRHHLETELPRQYQFLKGLVEAGLPSVLVAGTCLEYGLQSGQLSEDLAPEPVTPYGQAKDSLRRQLELLKAGTPFSLAWARLFYTYGAGQSRSSLYSMLRDAAARGETAFNMSGGEQQRDFLPVAELARALVRLALCGTDPGTVNICSGEPVTVRSLVERWLRLNNWDIELNLGWYPYPDYEPMAFWGDARKLQRILRSKRC